MKPASGFASLLGMAIITAGVLYLEMLQQPPDWQRAMERLVFLWIGAAGVLLPSMLGPATPTGGRRRHHRRRRTSREVAEETQS